MHDQTNNGAVEEMKTEKDKETVSEEERAAFFRDVRGKELNRLSANKRAVKEMHTEKDKETSSEEERAAFYKEFRSKELDRLTATLNKQSDEAGNQDVKTEPKIMKKESLHNQGETEALDTEETASEEDSLAFFQSVRETERKELVEAFERDKIWKEEREKRRMERRQEKIETMFEEFHTPAVSVLWESYSSPDQEPGPSNHYSQRSKSMSTDFKTKRVDTEEVKIDLTLLGDNKEEDREEEDYPDTPKTPNSAFSDIEDPSKPRLNPFFTPLEERHESTRVHLSTNPKSTE